MTQATDSSEARHAPGLGHGEPYYRRLLRRTLAQLLLLYLVPLGLLVGFSLIQYRSLARESRRTHLRAIAESQALTLDFFLRERVVDLSNLLDDCEISFPPGEAETAGYLARLQASSGAFEELAFFDGSGSPISYAGPFPDLETRDYGGEPWFMAIRGSGLPYIITDSYLGFRERPHFAIAVKKRHTQGVTIVRAVIFPGKIHAYLDSLQQTHDTRTAIVDVQGRYQVAPPTIGQLLETSPFSPPTDTSIGDAEAVVEGRSVPYAFAWLQTTGWVLVVQEAGGDVAWVPGQLVLLALVFLVVGVLAIWVRARSTVRQQRETDETEASLSGQLVQAAKLASVGELASGIAHEINNPLAIIAEEVGLIKDLMQPEFAGRMTPERLERHLENIHEATFRCRDITRKLLGFVRQDDVSLEEHDVHDLLDGVVDGMLGASISVTNLQVVKDYSPDLPRIVTDRGQLEQVFLNIVKNAIDAMGDDGKLILHTSHTATTVKVTVTDTGCGMSPEQLEQIFMPFYTTKDVGQGTGLGLSVSFGIVKSLGGEIYVDSKLGTGSRFAVELPIRP